MTANKNIALVGCDGATAPVSLIGQLELQQGYTVKMIMASDDTAAALLRADWPEARIVTDVQNVLDDASIGLVILSEGDCLPSALAGAFLRAGKSVRILNRQMAG